MASCLFAAAGDGAPTKVKRDQLSGAAREARLLELPVLIENAKAKVGSAPRRASLSRHLLLLTRADVLAGARV